MSTRSADAVTVFSGRHILSPGDPPLEAFAVADGRIVATGDRGDLAREHPGARQVDLGGALVVPGFNDAHCHVSQEAFSRVRVPLHDATTRADVVRPLRERAAGTSGGEWVVGQSLHADGIEDGRIDRDLLDLVSRVHPVLVIEYSFHRAVVNSAGLAAMGYASPDDAPAGGRLPVDDSGRLDGWLIERAWLDQWLPGTGRDSVATAGELDAQVAALREVNDELHGMGITSYCDAIVTPAEIRLYEEAAARGQLSARVGMLLWHTYADRQTWSRPLAPADRLRMVGVKMMLDGAFSGGTCLCSRPYDSSTGTGNGLQILDAQEFRSAFRRAESMGARVAVHANGDEAIGMVLDVIEELGEPSASRPRHRIEHCSITTQALVDRLAAQRVVAVPFGPFPLLFGDTLRGFYGEERMDWSCAHRSLLDGGVDVAGSSDYPIVTANPLLALQSMVTRTTLDGRPAGLAQRVSLEEALHVYTAGSAQASGEAHVKGRLAVGQLADFVVLGEDLTRLPATEIAEAPVLSTWVGGEEVWAASGQTRS